jgi:putative hydrolase of the HAD superfamily
MPELVRSPSDTLFRAVIFDLGGVVCESPLAAIAAYEAEIGLPVRFIPGLVIAGGDHGPWSCLERGELDPAAFSIAFATEARAAGHDLDATALLRRIAAAALVRLNMLAVLRQLRTAGLRVAALTNSWSMPVHDARVDALRPEFDCFVESHRVGMRKPERRIYELVCRTLAVQPAAAILLDDLGGNLKPARAMGMTTIKVGEPALAIAELERLTGVALSR